MNHNDVSESEFDELRAMGCEHMKRLLTQSDAHDQLKKMVRIIARAQDRGWGRGNHNLETVHHRFIFCLADIYGVRGVQ
jgi:hypothetical protein